MRNLRSIILLSLSGVVACLANADTMNITTKKTYPIQLNGDAVTVIIGDTDVADVVAPTERLIMLSGIGPGSTNLLILDKDNKEILKTQIVVGLNNDDVLNIRRGADASTRYICTDQCTRER